MSDLQKNNVPATNQVKQNVFIHENSGIRILFAGNSITKHSPRPAMGWDNDCGMAASDVDHDYVHLILAKIREYDKNVAWAIAQVGGYEANLLNGALPSDSHTEAANFGADIIIMFYGANTPKEYDTMENPPRTFGDAYEEMRNFLDKDKKASFFAFFNKKIPLFSFSSFLSLKRLNFCLIKSCKINWVNLKRR